ncbi:TPA: hypothetical protein JG914_004640 [Enterobacter hormaechei subsp. steigerwaltii]|nr:hypothetical protein [Enterobacter hormaechei subsp. steigerwaltii]
MRHRLLHPDNGGFCVLLPDFRHLAVPYGLLVQPFGTGMLLRVAGRSFGFSLVCPFSGSICRLLKMISLMLPVGTVCGDQGPQGLHPRNHQRGDGTSQHNRPECQGNEPATKNLTLSAGNRQRQNGTVQCLAGKSVQSRRQEEKQNQQGED